MQAVSVRFIPTKLRTIQINIFACSCSKNFIFVLTDYYSQEVLKDGNSDTLDEALLNSKKIALTEFS
ncbi:hypothetical protein [Gloeothece citriformis]|uniref:hypothetical protein n=1 Tax=Gloeothece citriformis TaxID=2546356 RepID=UPI00059E71A2|nr:hypothetical protein [Gloeothece citriformis]